MQPPLKTPHLHRHMLRGGCFCPPLKVLFNRICKDYCSSDYMIYAKDEVNSLLL